MAESSPQDGRSSTSALYSSFRRRIKSSRSQTSSSIDSEASAATATSDDSVALTSTDITSVESIPETKEEADESKTTNDDLNQPSSSPQDDLEVNPMSESDPLPQERRSKRKMFYAAVKTGMQTGRSLTTSFRSDASESSETAEKALDPILDATDENKVLSAPTLVESPPALAESPLPALSSFTGLSLVESIDDTSISNGDASAAADASLPESQPKRSKVYASFKSRISGSRTQTRDSVSSVPEVKVASISVVSAEEVVNATTAASAVELLSVTAIQTTEVTAVNTTEESPVKKADDLDKKLEIVLPHERQNTLEVQSWPEITDMLKTVELLDVTNDIICDFERTKIVGMGGYADIYVGILKIRLESGETVDLQVAVKCIRTAVMEEKSFVKVGIRY